MDRRNRNLLESERFKTLEHAVNHAPNCQVNVIKVKIY
jgi:hypothetical protein